MGMQQPSQTGVLVKTSFFPLLWILYFVKTNVTIDGVENQLPWGEHFFPLPPGVHEVRVSVRYLLYKQMGQNAMSVQLAEAQVVKVRYSAPWLIFLKGKITTDV